MFDVYLLRGSAWCLEWKDQKGPRWALLAHIYRDTKRKPGTVKLRKSK